MWITLLKNGLFEVLRGLFHGFTVSTASGTCRKINREKMIFKGQPSGKSGLYLVHQPFGPKPRRA
jgi:hypothetical protein